MKVEVVTPEDYHGRHHRRSELAARHVTGMDQRSNARVITAMVPLANMFGYVNTLRSMSQGRAQFTMEFDHYEAVPQAVADEVRAKMASPDANREEKRGTGDHRWQGEDLSGRSRIAT